MEAYEYVAQVNSDGLFSIPEHLVEKVTKASKVRVMLLIENDDDSWGKFTMSEFFKGYSEMDTAYDGL